MNLDFKISVWIQKTFPTEKIRLTLSKINRGEVFFLVLLPFLWLSEEFTPFGWALLYVAIFVFVTDRTVLVMKKVISRKRPLISVAGKVDSNPDMKHSFPSAHSANSMVVVFILVFGFSFSPWMFLFSVFAGLGRLLSLHHYPSDIIGGWILGAIFGLVGVQGWYWIRDLGIFFQ